MQAVSVRNAFIIFNVHNTRINIMPKYFSHCFTVWLTGIAIGGHWGHVPPRSLLSYSK